MFHTIHARNVQGVSSGYSCAKTMATCFAPLHIAGWLPMWPLNHLSSRPRRRNPWRTVPAEKITRQVVGTKTSIHLHPKKNTWVKKLTPKKKNAFFWNEAFFLKGKLLLDRWGGVFLQLHMYRCIGPQNWGGTVWDELKPITFKL